MVAGYQNLSRFDVDGTNFFETDLAFKQAVDRARKGKGPSVIVSHVVRLLPHSSSDDQRKYRTEKDLESDKNRDPIIQFEKYCIKEKAATKSDFEKIQTKVSKQVDDDDETACKKLLQGLYKINKDFEVPSMKNFGIDQKNFEDQLENMATDAEISGAPGLNPRVPSVKEMINLYEEAWRAF